MSEKRASSDSITVKSTTNTSVIKENTRTNRQTVSATRKGSDSGYSRTTVIKEYFSDEFDFDSPSSASSIKSPRQKTITPALPIASDYPVPDTEQQKLRYRETTVTEAGRIIQSVQKARTSENNNGTQHSDSSVTMNQDQSNIKKSTEESTKTVTKRKLFPGWAIGVTILIVLIIIYCYYKNYTPSKLWQILTKRTK